MRQFGHSEDHCELRNNAETKKACKTEERKEEKTFQAPSRLFGRKELEEEKGE